MLKWEGFAYAVAAAVGHSGIDASRKMASQRFSSTELVGLVGLLDAVFLSSFVFGTGLVTSLNFMSSNLLTILAVSAGLKVLCGFMYQRALYVSPLSVTVPYLAFTPALIVLTSFIMIGERPSSQGLAGVIVVTLGGYLLALESGNVRPAKKDKLSSLASSPATSALEIEAGSVGVVPKVSMENIPQSKGLSSRVPTSSSGLDLGLGPGKGAKQAASDFTYSSEETSNTGRENWTQSEGKSGEALFGRERVGEPSSTGLGAAGPGLWKTAGTRMGAEGELSGVSLGTLSGHGWLSPGDAEEQAHLVPKRNRNTELGKEMDKDKAGHLAGSHGRVLEAGRTERGQSGLVERVVTEAGKGGSPSKKLALRVIIPELQLTSGDELSTNRRRIRFFGRQLDAVRRGLLVVCKGPAAHLSALIWSRMGQVAEPLLALRKEEGSGLMLGCAALLSFTNSFDKMGTHVSSSVLVFATLQRILMAIPSVTFLALTSPRSFFGLLRSFPLLASISFFEILAIVCYLKSLDSLLVSYSVATKRSNILVSVMVGNLLFKENIWRKLPYILLMMVGMLLIVFA